MLISVKDEISAFMPARPARLVILGTMGTIAARTFNEQRPPQPFFYAHRNNHFWRLMQLIFNPQLSPAVLTLEQKKALLETHQIALANIVDQIFIDHSLAQDPGDAILFKAHKQGLLRCQKVSPIFKDLLQHRPIFFTCRQKPPLSKLLTTYFQTNDLPTQLVDQITFLPSPTRCSLAERYPLWQEALNAKLCLTLTQEKLA